LANNYKYPIGFLGSSQNKSAQLVSPNIWVTESRSSNIALPKIPRAFLSDLGLASLHASQRRLFLFQIKIL